MVKCIWEDPGTGENCGRPRAHGYLLCRDCLEKAQRQFIEAVREKRGHHSEENTRTFFNAALKAAGTTAGNTAWTFIQKHWSVLVATAVGIVEVLSHVDFIPAFIEPFPEPRPKFSRQLDGFPDPQVRQATRHVFRYTTRAGNTDTSYIGEEEHVEPGQKAISKYPGPPLEIRRELALAEIARNCIEELINLDLTI